MREPRTAEIRRRTAHVNGVELSVLEAGDPDDLTVVLSHGFPESAFSWRHQLPALAAAGYHVLTPDQRGYGDSSVPSEVSAYGIEQLTGDLVALLDDAGKNDAVFVGHDWGAFIVWDLARLHPDRARAVVGVSVPAVEWHVPPLQAMRAAYQHGFHYVVYFQEVGPAEAELSADPYATIRSVFWGMSAEGFALPTSAKGEMESRFLTNLPSAPPLPWAWLTEDDLRHYADQFTRSGFFGPVSYYRNLDANFEIVKDIGFDRVTMPSFFIGGAADPVLVLGSGGMFVGLGTRQQQIDAMSSVLPNYFGAAMIDRAGHWLQQERPEQFNEALLGFLAKLEA